MKKENSNKDIELKSSIFNLAKDLVTIINEIDQEKAKNMQNNEKG